MQFLCACIRKSLLIIASVIPVNKMERKIFFRVSAAGVSWRIFFREFPPQMFYGIFSSGSFRRRCFMAYFLQRFAQNIFRKYCHKTSAAAFGIKWMAGGSPGLRAVSKEIKIWHVICCRGWRAGVLDYVPFQKKSRFGT